MAEQTPGSPDWWQSLGALIGGGGIGVVLLEMVKRMIPKRASKDELAESYTERLRLDYDKLVKRYEELELRCDTREHALELERDQERALNLKQLQTNIILETENRMLRARYHRIRGYCQMLLGKLFEYLGENKMEAEIPKWVDEYVPGPTVTSRELGSGEVPHG